MFKMTIAYDGTRYGGWQVQSNALSIQTVIQSVLTTILRMPISIVGSGRTDAGVHAYGQVAHFSYDRPLDEKKTLLSINALLPPDIRVRQLEPVPSHFHARYSATSKVYHYHIHTHKALNPWDRWYVTSIFHDIDLNILKTAATHFLGTHDFTSFANEATQGSAGHDAVRTLHRLDVAEQEGIIRLEFEANGFLYKMVRNIVGTLLDTSKGIFHPHDIPRLLAAKDRRQAGKTAPPEGLFLMHVHYPSHKPTQ